MIGRNLLVTTLMQAGVEVARPERDRGIDLIAYLDRDAGRPFVACPIQMKATRSRSFLISKRWEDFDRLLIAYVWHVEQPQESRIYCLSYVQALGIARDAGWLDASAWKDKGYYVSTKPSKAIELRLEPHRMPGTAGWPERLRTAAALTEDRLD